MTQTKFYIADELVENGEQKVIIKEEMSSQEVNCLFQSFDFLSDITPAEIAYEISIRNGREFLSYMKNENLALLYFEEKTSEKALSTEANRLVYNLCASVKTFIDYSQKALNKRKDVKEDFERYLSSVFDSKEDISYRFFDKLRNFCIHYSFPFSKVKATSQESIDILCEKSHLQEYNGWGAIVSKDLDQMPDIICIPSLVEPLLISITTINLMLYYYFVQDYYTANSKIANLLTKYNLHTPIILSVDEDKKTTLRPIPISQIICGIGKLKALPNVTVKMVPIGEEQGIEICQTEDI